MGIPRKFTSGTVSMLLVKTRNILKGQAVQWLDGPDKTGSNGVGNEGLGTKPGGDESVERIGAPQLGVQKLELEQQPASQELIQVAQEALS